MELQPHQQRVCEEYVGVAENVMKLGVFMDSANFYKLSFVEQELLREQLMHMTGYQATLRKRLSLWGVEHGNVGNTIALLKDGQPLRSQHGT